MRLKLFFRTIICLFINTVFFGCIVIDGDGFNAEKIYGSGTVVSEKREIAVFDQIHLRGTGKVILTRAASQNVRVETDDNIMPHIRTEVKNGQLVIFQKRKNLRPTVLTIYISAVNLEGVSISGSGDILGSDEFNSKKFYADIAGSGDISLNISAERLRSNISGSGSIHFSGSTNSFEVAITGSGDVDAFEMQARESSVVITGSGDCRVHVSDLLLAKITGSGDVLYKGRPQISESITGSGKVKDRN